MAAEKKIIKEKFKICLCYYITATLWLLTGAWPKGICSREIKVYNGNDKGDGNGGKWQKKLRRCRCLYPFHLRQQEIKQKQAQGNNNNAAPEKHGLHRLGPGITGKSKLIGQLDQFTSG